MALVLLSLLSLAVIRSTADAAFMAAVNQSRTLAAADVADAQFRLRSLFAEARSCELDRLDYPVRDLSASHIRLVTSTNEDPHPDFVLVSAIDGELRVYEVSGPTGSCEWPSFDGVEPEVLASGEFAFAAVTTDGRHLSTLACEGVTDYSDCRISTVTVEGTVDVSELASFPFLVSSQVSAEWGRR